MNEHHCRVCGLYNDDPPWGEDGETAIFEYCLCCGVEFGYQDQTIRSTHEFREIWLKKGAHWSFIRFKPDEWDLEEQLNNIPVEFK